jgi:signal transduction histidine kinase
VDECPADRRQRRRAAAFDASLALSLTFTSIAALWGGADDARNPTIAGAVLVMATTLPLALRRRFPIAVLAITTLGHFVLEVLDFHSATWVGLFVALYTVASRTTGRRRNVTAWVFGTANAVMLVAGWLMDEAHLGQVVTAAAFLVGVFVAGDNVQRRRRAREQFIAEADRREREREMMAHQRVLDERARIARELHDVVAHSVSLMIIQAGAARRSLATNPSGAEQALRGVENTGRTAMDELRRVLGVLRDPDAGETVQRAPQPTLAEVRTLVDSDPSLPVRLREVGTPPALVPATVGLSMYRVVQEALTNVRKHAGTVRHVDVQVHYEPRQVSVQVVDDGRGASVARNGAGHGLVGMRERMSLCGGTVTAGPRPGGGWQVRATAPLGSEA